MFKTARSLSPVVLALLTLAAPMAVRAADVPRPVSDIERKGLDYILASQHDDGSFSMAQANPGVTALVVQALLQSGKTPDDPAVKKAINYVMTFKKADGGFYDNGLVTYNTAIVLDMLAKIPGDTQKDQIKKTQDFLKSLLAMEGKTDDKGQPITKDHPWYGGAGYTGQSGYGGQGAKRPDLSNTSFVIEALADSGIKKDDPAMQAMLVFVSRNQAYAETNPLPWAKGRDEGGFIYSLRFNDTLKLYGESTAPNSKDRDGNEILTTYGSMTYAGLKSFIYGGLTKDAPQVKAAFKWISNNYTLEMNPGLNNAQGLYYYYHVFPTALRLYGEATITDAKGVKHDWRADYLTAMKAHQLADGSFKNDADKWYEGDPVLCTTYVVLGLQEARK